MNITFRKTTLMDVALNQTALLAAHWTELPNAAQPTLDLHFEMYQLLDQQGKGVAFLVEADGVAVGYSAYFLISNPTESGAVVAENHVMYLDPKLRGMGVGAEFQLYCEEQLLELGVDQVILQFKPHAMPVNFLKELGYVMAEVRFTKRLYGE